MWVSHNKEEISLNDTEMPNYLVLVLVSYTVTFITYIILI